MAEQAFQNRIVRGLLAVGIGAAMGWNPLVALAMGGPAAAAAQVDAAQALQSAASESQTITLLGSAAAIDALPAMPAHAPVAGTLTTQALAGGPGPAATGSMQTCFPKASPGAGAAAGASTKRCNHSRGPTTTPGQVVTPVVLPLTVWTASTCTKSCESPSVAEVASAAARAAAEAASAAIAAGGREQEYAWRRAQLEAQERHLQWSRYLALAFGVGSVLAGVALWINLGRKDAEGVRFSSHWGGFGGADGGWHLSGALVNVLICGLMVGAAVILMLQAEPGPFAEKTSTEQPASKK